MRIYYRVTARVFVVGLILVAVFVVPLVGAFAPLNPPLQLSYQWNQGSPYCQDLLGGIEQDVGGSGVLTISGSNWAGPIMINGSGSVSGTRTDTIYASGGTFTQTFTFTASQISSYPSQTTSKFSFTHSYSILDLDARNGFDCGSPIAVTGHLAVYNSAGTQLLGNVSIFGVSGNSPTFQLLVELPMFNDTMLGVTVVNTQPQNPVPGVLYCPVGPCTMPLGDYYNFILGFSLVLIAIGVMISYATGSLQNKKVNLLLDLALPVIFVVAFPVIYNNVSYIVNWLDLALIAGPANSGGNLQVVSGNQIANLWSAASTNQGNWLGIISQPLIAFASWIFAVIVYIGSFILGTLRIWLLSVMIVAFPIALALKSIPFTKKLSSFIEETLYGLILASVMSSIVLGLAANLISGSSASLLNGISNQWIASVALLTALMIPTIFAPLAGVLFQTGMQAGMAAGGTAILATAGAGMGGVGGVQAGMAGAGGVTKALGSGASATANIGQEVAQSIPGTPLGTIGTGVFHAVRNAGLGFATGMMTGVGMYPASKALGRIAPMRTPGEIVSGRQAAMRQAAVAQQVSEVNQLVSQHHATFETLFSQAGSFTTDTREEMKQKLGSHYMDPSTPQGSEEMMAWYHDTRTAKPDDLALRLSDHGQIDAKMYQSNPHYRTSVNQEIAQWKQRLNEMDPRKDPENLQKLADVRNALNLKPSDRS